MANLKSKDMILFRQFHKRKNYKGFYIRNNCHHHVAEVLNKVNYKGKNNWGVIDVAWMFISQGRYVRFLLKKKFFTINSTVMDQYFEHNGYTFFLE